MSEHTWNIATASVVGTSHAASGKPCQDEHRAEIVGGKRGQCLIACVADGAGSATKGDLGARIACRTWLRDTSIYIEEGWRFRDDYGQTWVQKAREELLSRATVDKAPMSDYACTFLGACVQPRGAVFVQIGDGAIVFNSIGELGKFEPVFWPEQGEYANTTSFLTDLSASQNIRSRTFSARIDELALFSDGLQRIALDYQNRGAFNPFFESMLHHVRPPSLEDRESLSRALASFLSSEDVNSRTDDDKTLVLASRLGFPNHVQEEL